MNKANKAKMLAGFTQFIERITAEYEEARAALHRDDYIEAHRILSELAMSHAKTSLSLRNMLVKEGLMDD